MLERRQQPRNRVYYGGMVAFNDRNSTFACVVRNFSKLGAKIEFENAALVPTGWISRSSARASPVMARLVWRDRNAAGLVFANVQARGRRRHSAGLGAKLRATERANRKLRSRLDQLLSEH